MNLSIKHCKMFLWLGRKKFSVIVIKNQKKVRILAHMVSSFGSVYKYSPLENNGRWNPDSNFFVVYISKVLSVKGKIEDSILG